MTRQSQIRMAMRHIPEFKVASKSISVAPTIVANAFELRAAGSNLKNTLDRRSYFTSSSYRGSLCSKSLFHPYGSGDSFVTSRGQQYNFSSKPQQTPPANDEQKPQSEPQMTGATETPTPDVSNNEPTQPSKPTAANDGLISTADPYAEPFSTDNYKSIFSKLWDKYSIEGQRKTIILGERLFRAAQVRANDVRWYREGRIPYEFRHRHAILTMHVWFLHKRLLADRVDPHAALLVQEELFDILWNDTRARIRAEGVNELTVNKHLKDVQQITFLHCTQYDDVFQEHAKDDKKRIEELAQVIWTHVLNKDEECYNDQLKRLAAYVEYQFMNLACFTPDDYFWQGRIPWGDMPDFSKMQDNGGKVLDEVGEDEVPKGFVVLPKPWVKTLTDAGETYYWNVETMETSWKKPV